ncbi:MAG: lactate utilization protein [Acidaminococcaceae bacterium]
MDIQRTIENLKKKKYQVSFFETAQEAAVYLDKKIDGKLIGFGDSESMLSLGLYEMFSKHNEVHDPMHCKEGENFLTTAKKCLTTDIFLTSVNALAETGEMVNVDGTGNRVAGSLFGHDKVYFVIGTNKITPTLDEALYRARNVAAPMNAARHKYKTPCAVKQDKCYDCMSPDRICCGQLIYYQKMRNMEMEVVLINESLGL